MAFMSMKLSSRQEKKKAASLFILSTNNYDTGAILAQTRVPVMPDDTPETLAARVLEQEHILYAETLQKIVTGEIPFPS